MPLPSTDARPVLLWYRQDLRTDDHAALHDAAGTGRPLVPLYVLDREAGGRWAIGAASRWWLHHSLASLRERLASLGATLILRAGPWAETVAAVAREVDAVAICAGRAIDPAGRAAETALDRALAAEGRALRLFRTTTLFDPDALRTRVGGVFQVYTAYMRAGRAAGVPMPVPAPKRLLPFERATASDNLDSWDLLPSNPDWAGGFRQIWQPGEDGAHNRLEGFLKTGLDAYHTDRNLPAKTNGTSALSPHLRHGETSPVRAWHAAADAAARHSLSDSGLETFQNELIWREFAAYLLWHRPTLPDQPLTPNFTKMPIRHAPDELRAWQRGQTGVPIVDAGMRQLWRIGWIHNRVRMIVASFLIKHLLIAWQDGEAWFWDTLVDADLASNSMSWQWVAGTGADAAPFFRIFNPVLQAAKFDPDGAYVRAYVPELGKLSAAHIHAPWLAPELELAAAGVRLGETYPRPIVDLAEGRARALAALRVVTGHDS